MEMESWLVKTNLFLTDSQTINVGFRRSTNYGEIMPSRLGYTKLAETHTSRSGRWPTSALTPGISATPGSRRTTAGSIWTPPCGPPMPLATPIPPAAIRVNRGRGTICLSMACARVIRILTAA
jgi:hypothetical protein